VAWSVRALTIVIVLVGAAAYVGLYDGGIAAGDPAYDVPGGLALPWACGEGYVVTWGPDGHWAERKASGLAYDFSLPEGTPLYSPGHGHIYYLRDERPFDTNLGNYVEIVVDDDWLIRLAHLRDPQSGEGPVRAGEFVGYSGSTGVPLAHLHMELFVREGSRWVAPNLEQTERLFGLPVGDLVEGATVTNDGCPAQVALSGPVLPLEPSAPLGQAVTLRVPLHNDGLETITLDVVQVSLAGPDGTPLVVRAEGEWLLDAKSEAVIPVTVLPPRAGEWSVGRVTCGAGEATFGLPGEGAFEVLPSDLRLIGVSVPPEVRVGERIVLEAWVENGGAGDLRVNELEVRGVQPDGLPWSAVARQGRTIRAGEVRRFDLEGMMLPERVGEWRIVDVGYRAGDAGGGPALLFAAAEGTFSVVGPELRAESLRARVDEGTLSVALLLANVGNDTAIVDRVEVWGWKPDGEEPFVLEAAIDPVAPGGSAVVRLEGPLGVDEGLWRLIEAGYWVDGTYLRVPLPEQPTVATAGSAVATPETAKPAPAGYPAP